MLLKTSPPRDRLSLVRRRRGQALVEFAIISFLLVTILSGTLGLGIMLLRANIGVVATSSISNTLDQQIDEGEFELVNDLTGALAAEGYFQETDLVLSTVEYQQARQDFASSGVSLLIRDLLPLYQYQQLDNGDEVYHFPGAIVERVADSELTVRVPITTTRDSQDRQIIGRWAEPVSFDVPSTQPDSPIATVSINYPASSGVLIAYSDTGAVTPSGDPVRQPVSSEVSPSSVAIPSEYRLRTAGDNGFDSAFAYLTSIRVFQRVLTQSSTFRSKDPVTTAP